MRHSTTIVSFIFIYVTFVFTTPIRLSGQINYNNEIPSANKRILPRVFEGHLEDEHKGVRKTTGEQEEDGTKLLISKEPLTANSENQPTVDELEAKSETALNAYLSARQSNSGIMDSFDLGLLSYDKYIELAKNEQATAKIWREASRKYNRALIKKLPGTPPPKLQDLSEEENDLWNKRETSFKEDVKQYNAWEDRSKNNHEASDFRKALLKSRIAYMEWEIGMGFYSKAIQEEVAKSVPSDNKRILPRVLGGYSAGHSAGGDGYKDVQKTNLKGGQEGGDGTELPISKKPLTANSENQPDIDKLGAKKETARGEYLSARRLIFGMIGDNEDRFFLGPPKKRYIKLAKKEQTTAKKWRQASQTYNQALMEKLPGPPPSELQDLSQEENDLWTKCETSLEKSVEQYNVWIDHPKNNRAAEGSRKALSESEAAYTIWESGMIEYTNAIEDEVAGSVNSANKRILPRVLGAYSAGHSAGHSAGEDGYKDVQKTNLKGGQEGGDGTELPISKEPLTENSENKPDIDQLKDEKRIAMGEHVSARLSIFDIMEQKDSFFRGPPNEQFIKLLNEEQVTAKRWRQVSQIYNRALIEKLPGTPPPELQDLSQHEDDLWSDCETSFKEAVKQYNEWRDYPKNNDKADNSWEALSESRKAYNEWEWGMIVYTTEIKYAVAESVNSAHGIIAET